MNKTILLISMSLSVCFIVIEVSLRMFYPQELETTTEEGEKLSPRIYIANYNLSHSLRPNTTARYLSPYNDFNSSININQDGFNDVDVNNSKIICLGDSVTFGHGVDYDKTYCYNLKNMLNTTTLNAGVPSYSADQEYLMFKRILKYKPEIIIVNFVANDIEDLSYHSLVYQNGELTKIKDNAYYVDDNNRLRLSWKKYSYGVNPIIYKINEFFASKLHSFILFKTGFRNILIPLFVDKKRAESFHYPISKGLSSIQKQNFDITLNLYKEMNKISKENNITFILLPHPHNYQVYSTETKNYQRKAKIKDEDLDLLKYQDILRVFSDENNITFFNPYDYFVENKDDYYIYFEHDKHLSEYGHRLMTEFIVEELGKLK